MDREEIEAAVMDLLAEMEGDLGDSHEICLRLQQLINSMRAMNMPIPDDLRDLEARLGAAFEADTKP